MGAVEERSSRGMGAVAETFPNSIDNRKGDPMSPEGHANVYRYLIEVELSHGTKFYDAATNEPLTTPKQIVKTLLSENEVRYDAGARTPLVVNLISAIGEGRIGP
jgi:hypothetical protein